MSAAGYQFREFIIPDYMAEGLDLWIKAGVLPGGFLTAILCNDLMEACSKADSTNLRNLPAYCCYLYNEAPTGCHGSREKVEAWIKEKAAERGAVAYMGLPTDKQP